MATFRRAAGLIAAILLLVIGIGLAATGSPVLGLLVVLAGFVSGIWQVARLWRTRTRRSDPYDLSRLWDYDPSDPVAEEALEEEARRAAQATTLYCHHCGHAVPDLFAHCPECGQRLR